MSIEDNANVSSQRQPTSYPDSTANHRRVMPRLHLLAAAVLVGNGMLFANPAAAAGTDAPPGTLIPALPYTDPGSTVGFDDTYQNYGGVCATNLPFPYPGADAFYRVQLNSGATYSFNLDLTGSAADQALFLLASSADAGSCVASSQDTIGTGAGPELLDFIAPASQEYFLAIDSYYAAGSPGSEGIYSLTVECTAGDCSTGESADLSITKDDGVTEAAAGDTVTYTITAQNAGPSDVIAADVTDFFPAECASVSWSCVGAGGGACAAGGTGDIDDIVDLPAGATATYTADCSIDPVATGTLVNTATVGSATPDPDTDNNSASDTDTITANLDVIFVNGFDG